MYAIVQVGSLQYKVSEGDLIDVQTIDQKEGKAFSLEPVLLYSKGTTVKVGQPYLKDVKVTAKVLGQKKDEKVIAFKYWRRKNSELKKGHRQKLTALSIVSIEAAE
ncbi:MAG: 50S ribosomal protein L21 [Candidatus Omnitrophica bacterium]|nr:50S ribosomal protein L21 [Candidatus Omnitrophota bacterium]